MTIKHKIEIAPGHFATVETEIPVQLTAIVITALLLSLYNFYVSN